MSNLLQVCQYIAHWLTALQPQDPHWSPETWEQFKFACRVHGIAPLLHEKLSGVDWLEPSLRAWLEQQYTCNTQRVAKMQAELKVILALFAAHDVPLMPLKGSILSVDYYPDPGHRPMADLDLLVRPEQRDRAGQLLAQLGYQQEVIHWKHIEWVKPDNRQVVSTEVEHPDNPRKLELHLYCRESFGGPTIDLTEQMWVNAAPAQLLDQPAILPSAAALWLHLLVHNTYHLWQGKGRLIQLVDLVRLSPYLSGPARKRGVDLDHLLNSVDARYTYPSLALLQKTFPAAVPSSLLIKQRARLPLSFRRWADSLDLVNSSYLNPNPQGLYLLKALKFSQGRPAEMLQALRFALLPSLDEIALDHPRLARSKMPWLAYFLLPLDWAKRLSGSPKK